MSLMIFLVVLIAGGLLTVGIWRLVRQGLQATHSPAITVYVGPEDAQAAQKMFRKEASASTVSLAVILMVLAGMFTLGSSKANLFGLPYALAGMLAALAGILVLVLQPRLERTADRPQITAAELVPRGATSFASQWVFILPLVASLALLAGLVITGLYSATDGNGLHRVFQYRTLSGWGVEEGQIVGIQYNISAAGPFPGWYYGLPIMLCTLMLIGVVYWTLRKTALAPRPTRTSLFAVDTHLRTLRTRLIMSISAAALGFQVSGLTALTGFIFRSANLETVPTAEVNAVSGSVPIEPGHTLSLLLLILAVVIGVASVVLAVKALAVVLQLWWASKDHDARFRAEPAQ